MASEQLTTRIIVFGSAGVGKTTLVLNYIYKYVQQYYDEGYIEDSFRKIDEITLLGVTQTVAVHVLDTAGVDEFTAMRELYIRQGDAYLILLPAVPPSQLGLSPLHPWDFARELVQTISKVRQEQISDLNLAIAETKIDLKQKQGTFTMNAEAVSYLWPSVKFLWTCCSHLPLFRDVGVIIKKYLLGILGLHHTYSLFTRNMAEEFNCPIFETSGADKTGCTTPFQALALMHHSKIKTLPRFCFPPDDKSRSLAKDISITSGLEYSDLTAVVDRTYYKLHKTIIACRFPGFLEHFQNKDTIELDDTNASMYEALASWVYTGQLKVPHWEYSGSWTERVKEFGCFPLLKGADWALTESETKISFETIFNQNVYSDVQIKIGKKIIFGHKVIISARSLEFRRLLKDCGPKLTLKEDYEQMFFYLKWMYTDELDPSVVDIKLIQKMMKMSDRYQQKSGFFVACEARIYGLLFGGDGGLKECSVGDLADLYQWAIDEKVLDHLVIYLSTMAKCVSVEDRQKIKTQNWRGQKIPTSGWIKRQIPLQLQNQNSIQGMKDDKENCIIS